MWFMRLCGSQSPIWFMGLCGSPRLMWSMRLCRSRDLISFARLCGPRHVRATEAFIQCEATADSRMFLKGLPSRSLSNPTVSPDTSTVPLNFLAVTKRRLRK
jgi:hypothetical protein